MTQDQLIQQWSELFVAHAAVVVVAGISGILISAGLMWAWRNYLRRQRRLEQRRAQRTGSPEVIDVWQSAAHRLQEPGTQRPPGYPFTSDDPDEADDTWHDSYEDDTDLDDDDEEEPPPWS